MGLSYVGTCLSIVVMGYRVIKYIFLNKKYTLVKPYTVAALYSCVSCALNMHNLYR